VSEIKLSADSLPDLEEPCPLCLGDPGRSKTGSGLCEHCDGYAVVPTEFGVRVLDLMRHNIRRLFGEGY
jgi:hypothetical protein